MAEAEKGAGAVWRGIKGGILIFLLFPFILFLMPMWFIYRAIEVRSGRPVPENPLAYLWSSGRRHEPVSENFSRPDGFPQEEDGFEAVRRPDVECEVSSVVGTALVTGGSGRLGAMLCRELAKLGYSVAVAYHRSGEEARVLVEEIVGEGGRGAAFSLDLTNPARIVSLVSEVERALGSITLLINNAAVFHPDPDQGGWEIMGRQFLINLQGPLWLSMKVSQEMMRGGRQGQIINMGDYWGEHPLGGHVGYGASKAGLIMATRVMAKDWAPGIRVNAIAPGAVLSPEGGDGGFQRMLSRTPLAARGGPEAVVRAVRYLLAADFVTGEVLHVDGGRDLV